MIPREIKFGPVYRGRDVHQTPEGRSYNLTNVYRTKDGALRKRPGYDLFKDYSVARYINRIWANPLATAGLLVSRNSAGANAIVDWLALDGTVTNLINATDANLLNNQELSAVGISSTRVCMASGLDIIDVSGIPSAPVVTPLTNGPAATNQINGLTFARGYLFALGGASQQLTYFNNNAALSFNTAADWRSFENNRKPDFVRGIFNIRDEICNLGQSTVEFAWLDGVSPWAEVDASYIPYGARFGSEKAAAQIRDDVYFITLVDGQPKVVRIMGESHHLEDISADIDATFKENTIPTITDGEFELFTSDLYGSTFNYDSIPYYMLSDRGARNGITLLYDTLHKEWLRWGAYSGSIFTELPLRHFAMPEFATGTTPTLGLRGPYILASDNTQNSRIYALDGSFKDDDGTAIRCELETGKITHSTMNLKRCEYYRFYVKRVDNGSFTLYVNDENQGYDAGETVSLDPNENSEYIMAEVRNVGTYRSRQIKLVHSSATDDFELVRMEEGYTVLGR